MWALEEEGGLGGELCCEKGQEAETAGRVWELLYIVLLFWFFDKFIILLHGTKFERFNDVILHIMM